MPITENPTDNISELVAEIQRLAIEEKELQQKIMEVRSKPASNLRFLIISLGQIKQQLDEAIDRFAELNPDLAIVVKTRENIAWLSEHQELINCLNLKSQFQSRLETLEFFGFTEKPAPAYEDVIASFTKEDLELASTFQVPTLLLIPETSFARKVQAINENKAIEGQKDCFTYLSSLDPENTAYEITGYHAVIVEGTTEMNDALSQDLKDTYTEVEEFVKKLLEKVGSWHLKDNIYWSLMLNEFIKRRKKIRKSNEKGMDRHKYALFIMEVIRAGDLNVIKRMFTFLDDDFDLSACFIPAASFNDCSDEYNVEFGLRSSDIMENIEYQNPVAFRSSVGGDVLIK